VRVKASLLLLSFVLAGVAYPADTSAVDTTQLAAWLTAGVSNSRLARLVQERGLANLPTRNELCQLESAGADSTLIRV